MRFIVRFFAFLGTHHSFNLTVYFIAASSGYRLAVLGTIATLTRRCQIRKLVAVSARNFQYVKFLVAD